MNTCFPTRPRPVSLDAERRPAILVSLAALMISTFGMSSISASFLSTATAPSSTVPSSEVASDSETAESETSETKESSPDGASDKTSTEPVEQNVGDFESLYGTAAAIEKAVSHYLELATNEAWKLLTSEGILRSGSAGAGVDELRQRLSAEGYEVGSGAGYDAALVGAVEAFQARHGLAVDGIVGPDTREQLNVLPSERANQMEKNLERRRSYEARMASGRGILVNLPEQRLYAFDSESEPLSMKVVVGKPAWATPELREQLETVVLNPYWYVPIEILAEELAPKIAEDSNYLEKNGYEVVAEPGPNAEPMDASGIDWSQVRADDPSSFPHLLRRKPGSQNPLGKIKFLMPNRDDIYLHDTPADHLFSKSERDFSHGCIRVEDPIALAEMVVAQSEDWSASEIRKALDSGEHEVISLSPSLSVDVVYWTSWVDGDGTVHFRDDLYDRDREESGADSE